ncbi:hypothetical protein [Epilithonimonas mollis]|uniref:hypothetical protein n=1 Tax=Epilithonimonas mollis TaxID=216903 RepID=UPI001114D091|nr:hypothetical protein [Epilithonimonas mollis]
MAAEIEYFWKEDHRSPTENALTKLEDSKTNPEAYVTKTEDSVTASQCPADGQKRFFGIF